MYSEIAFKIRQLSQSTAEKKHITNVLSLLDLINEKETHLLNLDAGQRKMLALAFLAITPPNLLLLDMYWLQLFESGLGTISAQGTTHS